MSESASIIAGRYRLGAIIGRGGTAVVYRALDTATDTECAVKLLTEKRARDKTIRRRFLREAEIMVGLDHPNIVRVLDSGSDGERLYLVMELMRGASLGRGLKLYGALPERAAVEVVEQVCAGLHVAHQREVVHRDVKPANVLLSDRGIPKVTDFGIARIARSDSLTQTGAVMGSWPYMAPEQRTSARNVDRRADVFSAGAMLYALIRNEEPKDIYVPQRQRQILQGLSAPLATLIHRATQRRAEDRYQSAEELRAALRDILDLVKSDADEGIGLHDAPTFDLEDAGDDG